MIDWILSLYATSSADKSQSEASPSAEDDGSLLKLEKSQAWSMLLCAPLEFTGELQHALGEGSPSRFGADFRSTARISLPRAARLPTNQRATGELYYDVVSEILVALYGVVSRVSLARRLGDR
jgi:hypothetical protein